LFRTLPTLRLTGDTTVDSHPATFKLLAEAAGRKQPAQGLARADRAAGDAALRRRSTCFVSTCYLRAVPLPAPSTLAGWRGWGPLRPRRMNGCYGSLIWGS